jgi:multidrug efflux system outer membrane protein
MRSLLPVFTMGLAATVAGCALGPRFVAPVSPAPPDWAYASLAAPSSWPSPDWWTAFGSPQLNDLMASAQRGNTDLAAATARLQEAEAQAEIAGAPLYPSVSLNPTANPIRTLNRVGKTRQYVEYQGFANASYEIDFWGKNRAALESAQALVASSRFARDVVWLTTSSDIADLYFQSQALQDRLDVAHENLAKAQRTLEDVMRQEQQGLVPRLAVVQQQAVVAFLATVIPPLEQQLAATKIALAILVGQLPETFQLQPGSLHDLQAPPLAAGVPSQLLTRRPDVQQAEAELISANANIRVARAEFFPSFNLNLGAGVNAITLAQGGTPAIGAYSVLASIAQPIFQGGELRGQLNQTKARYQELLVGNYRHAVLSAYGDVELALETVKNAEDERAAQERNAALATETLGLARAGFNGGLETILNVLNAETAVYSAQNALVEAQLAYFQALVGLTKALGGGWERGANSSQL